MNVNFCIGRHIHVDHGFKAFHVQPARGDIGGHQHRAAAIGKLHQHLVAFALLQFTKQRQRAVALGLQHRHQIAALLLGVAKGQRALGAEMCQQLGHGVQALAFAHFVINLVNFVCTVLRFNLHRLRRTHELCGQLGNAFGIGCREQQRLAVFGALADHLGDVVEKAHVQHAIGFVEHQRVHTHQAQRTALQMVQNPAGRAHHHIGAVLQTHSLTTQRHATAQSDDFHV